jgi:hypothetical protein
VSESTASLLFPGNPLVALVFEERLASLGLEVQALSVEFPGGLPDWHVYPGDARSELQLRAIGGAQAGDVPFLPPPESVSVVLGSAGASVARADGATVASALSGALAQAESARRR